MKKRLIFDLSAPRSGPFASVNSLILPEPFSLHYASIGNAIKMIKIAGQGSWLAKADVTDVFKNRSYSPVLKSLWHQVGLNIYYFAMGRAVSGAGAAHHIQPSFQGTLLDSVKQSQNPLHAPHSGRFSSDRGPS